jgi:tRNA threonylcarbamoyladenosine biosynthesis protein TsaB
MNVLAIDTASPKPAVSLCRGDELFEEALPSDRRSSEALLPAVRRVLDSAKFRLEACERLAVCSGPGSFTGIRIGLATAWGLGRASGVPVEAVSTLEAMAEAARSPTRRRVASVLDAGRDEAVIERFDLDEPRARSLAPARRIRREEVVRIAGGETIVALPADLIEPQGLSLPVLVASALAMAVARAPREAASFPLQPYYVRPSAAEEKRGPS